MGDFPMPVSFCCCCCFVILFNVGHDTKVAHE